MLRTLLNRLRRPPISLRTYSLFSKKPQVSPFDPINIPSDPQVKLTTLPNGFRVATHHLNTETITIGVWIDAGSRYEVPTTNGSAHFLEHMAFKGTNSLSRIDIEKKIEQIGAHLNAYTSREQTVYYAKSMKRDADTVVQIISDILQNPLLDKAAMEAERGVILREYEEIEKQTEEAIFDHLHSVAFQNHSLGLTILGTRHNIANLTTQDLKNYIMQNYVGRNMVLAAAGNIEHEKCVEMAEKYFGGLSKDYELDCGPIGKSKIKPVFIGSEVRAPDTTFNNAHMVIAFEGVSWTSPDYFPLLVSQVIVGSWDRSIAGGVNLSSRLAQIMMKERMAQSFMSFNTSYNDTGLVGVYLVSDYVDALDDVTYHLQQEWVRLCLNLTEGEVERAKMQLRAHLLLSLDGTTQVCEDVGRQILTYGKRLDINHVNRIIDSITVDMVKEVASRYFYDKSPAIAAIGRIETMPDYNRIKGATAWLRV